MTIARSRSTALLLAVVLAACGGAEAPPPSPPPSCPPCAASPPPAAPTAAAAPVAAGGVDAVAAQLVERVNAKDAAAIVADFSPAMREALPPEKAAPWIEGILAKRGALKGIEREPGRGGPRSGVYRLHAERGDWRVELHVDDHGTILGLSFTDPPPPEPEVAKSTVAFSLPFRGRWKVIWGGPTLEVNQHVTHASQRRAADLLVVDEAGKTHGGDGKKNEDYFAYGQPVLAAADGVVTAIVDGVPDNAPGEMNPYIAVGNSITIEHDAKQYSVYAHLQPGSMRVKRGAKVKRGTVLGLCGNSGNSSEAHLHFQVQDGPRFERSWGVEAVFKDVPARRDDRAQTFAEYTFLKGDLVGTPAKP